jgi:hypothetical protein
MQAYNVLFGGALFLTLYTIIPHGELNMGLFGIIDHCFVQRN